MQHLYGTTTFEEGTMAYKQLAEIERYHIETLKREGFTQSAIARSLGRSRSTINRETRSIESWCRQFEAIQAEEAFLVLGEFEGEMVTAGYFPYSETNCLYGSSASRRDLFDKPLFHAIMWTAILHAKEIGCRWFEVGEQLYSKQFEEKSPSKKELGISDFKAGFGGETKMYLYLHWGGEWLKNPLL